jgi:hypothetical protein
LYPCFQAAGKKSLQEFSAPGQDRVLGSACVEVTGAAMRLRINAPETCQNFLPIVLLIAPWE